MKRILINIGITFIVIMPINYLLIKYIIPEKLIVLWYGICFLDGFILGSIMPFITDRIFKRKFYNY